jgi:hypothetical protein
MMCRRRQVAFINDVIITNAFSISRVMSEDSILLDIVQEKGNRFDYSIHNIFADGYNCVLMKRLIRPNEAALLLNNLIVVVWNPLIVVNAVRVFLPRAIQ